MFFPLLYSQHTCQTTYILSYTTKTMSKVQSEHTQSLHYKNIKQIFHMLELYSTSQIQFCHIGLPFIMCHFLVNNLHFITYSNCIVWPHWKNLHILLILSFPPNSPTFDFFYELKSLEATLDLTQLHVNSL